MNCLGPKPGLLISEFVAEKSNYAPGTRFEPRRSQWKSRSLLKPYPAFQENVHETHVLYLAILRSARHQGQAGRNCVVQIGTSVRSPVLEI
jgi:hypothetical protein